MALLSGLLKKTNTNEYQYAKLLDGSFPIFSQYGNDIYYSDVVQMAINCIAEEISKLRPRHIRTDNEEAQTIPKSSINRLFKFSPNPLMTTRDFLEKITWLLYMNYNCFIYPFYDVVIDKAGRKSKEYKAFYPLNPTQANFKEDAVKRLFVEFHFASGDSYTLPYNSLIHLRKKFSVNEVMGGGANGQPDNTALKNILTINDTVIEGLDKAIKTSLTIRGILKIATMLDDEKMKAERKRFEEKIESSKSGILPMDLKGEFIDLKPDPKVIDKDTMEFLQNKVLNWYGVPLKILSGDFDDKTYQSFYEKTLEPLLISFGQAFSKTLFTVNELNHGNEIIFYNRDMMYLSTDSKLKILEIAGAQGLLTDNQKLRILGYSPLPDGTGNRRTISLNYISTEIADKYQMNRAKNGGGNNSNSGMED